MALLALLVERQQAVIFELSCASVSKRVFVQNFSHENEQEGGTNFHMDALVRRLVLTQRQKATRKWLIDYHSKALQRLRRGRRVDDSETLLQ